MAKIQAGMNGFGRFGLHLLRYWFNHIEDAPYTISYINDDGLSLDKALDIINTDPYVKFNDFDVLRKGNHLCFVKGDRYIEIEYSNQAQADIHWLGKPDVVFECSGKATVAERCQPYLAGKTQRVLISATSWDADKTLVYGFNHQDFTPELQVVSYGSCTVNAYVPLANYMHHRYGLIDSDVNVVHNIPEYKLGQSFTLDRRFCTLETSAKKLLDFVDDTNFRVNYTVVPYTGASIIDFRFRVGSVPQNRETFIAELKEAMATGALQNLYGMVPQDNGPEEHQLTPFSSVFIEENINVIGDNLYIHAYFDTENSVNRYHDLASYVVNPMNLPGMTADVGPTFVPFQTDNLSSIKDAGRSPANDLQAIAQGRF
jgi:glyceraldehyde 3-phosphate dehydrogenase